MVKGLVIGTDGTLRRVEFADDTGDARLDGMYTAIGCRMVDVVGYSDTIDVWVDDEGIYNSVLNVELSIMLDIRHGGRGQGAWAGAGLFLGVDQESGTSRSLTPAEEAEVIRDWLRPRTDADLTRLGAAIRTP